MKRNRILYGCLFTAALIFIYFYGGKMPYTLFYVTITLPIISVLYTLLIYVRFKYSQDTSKKFAIKGDKINFMFSLTNEDIFLYPYLNVNLCGADSIFAKQFEKESISLPPFSGRNYNLDLECKYRGYYDVGIKSVEIEDFLGIFRLTYKIAEPKYITVYPRIVQLQKFRLKTNFISESQSVLNNTYEDLSTISDIRKYAYGDSLKKIHWKLTSKMNEIMVKNYQSTSETNASIFIDLKRNNFLPEENIIIEDKLIEAAVAVLHYCLSNWVHVKLVYYNEGLIEMEAKNPLQFDELYRVLSKVNFTQEIDIKDILGIYLLDNINKSNVIILTSNMSYDLYEQIYKTKLCGYDISLIYVSPEELRNVKDNAADEALSFLTEIGVSTYKINISDDIKNVLER